MKVVINKMLAFSILFQFQAGFSFGQTSSICGFKDENLNSSEPWTPKTPPWGDASLLPDRQVTRTIRLAIHRVLYADHSGIDKTQTQIDSLVSELNWMFAPVHIQFVLIENDVFYDNEAAIGKGHPSGSYDPTSLNLYLLQDCIVNGISRYGFSRLGESANIKMDVEYCWAGHEIGHSFGLYHTFERAAFGIENGIENITRVNTETCNANQNIAGDGIGDTEADIEGSNLKDNCDMNNYKYDTHNAMAYHQTFLGLRHFTNLQGRVMHYYIELYYGKQTGLNNTFSQTVRDETNSSVFFTNNLFTLLRSRHIHNGDIYYLFTDVTYLSSVLTENRLLNGKQHINWNDNPVKYQLKDEFTPLATNQDRIVRYETPITATVSASTLDGVNISSPPYLSDPWYADANGNQDLGLLPVSGSKSVFKDVAYDPAFPLNPYYQIKADAVTASNGLSLSFQNWATTGTGSINTVQATIQPIKITTDNATITANYKAMLASKTTGWVGNQFASNNGTSSVMYVSDGKLWLHRENGSDMKEILVSSSISNLQNFSVTANGNNRYWVLNNGTTTLSSGHEINGIVSTSSVPALSGIPSGRVEIVRINSITPKLALVAKIGSLIFRSLGTLETNNVTWSSWTPIPAIAAPIVVAGNGNVAFVTWIETSSIKGYKLNTDGTWSVQKTITSSSSGSFTSLATAANGSNGLDLLLVRANSQTNKKDLAVSAWNADNTTLPLTVLSTSTTYGDFKAVSLSSNSGLKLASVGVSTYVPNYSYYLWKHDHTSWNQESNPFSTTEQKLFHQEVTFTPSKTTVGTLEVMTQSPVNWGGMTKVTTGSEEIHVLSISGVQLTDTLIYSAQLDPSMVDSILIDTLGVWTVAVKGDGFVTETVNDLKLFGTSELVVNRDEAGTRREIRFIPDLTKWDVWVVDPSGNKVRMSKSEAEETGGEEIRELVAVYPNPFNPETRITVRLTEAKELKVRVYNLVGQLVADLASGTYERGDYAFRFDGRNLASGTYFYRVEIGNEVKTGKLQLLK